MNGNHVDALAVALVGLQEQERREYAGDLLHLHYELLSIFPEVPREQLERAGLANVMASGRQFLYLAPVRDVETWLPVMSVVGADRPAGISFQVALFAGKSIDDRSLGFRFESPEGEARTNEFGLHNFYHAQLCTALRPSGRKASTVGWLPVTQPSVPLDASDPTSLFAAMLLALYGTSILSFVRNAVGEFPQSVLRMVSISSQPVFLKVTPRNGSAVFCKTAVGRRDDAEARLKQRYPGARIEQCSSAAYHDSDERDRKDL